MATIVSPAFFASVKARVFAWWWLFAAASVTAFAIALAVSVGAVGAIGAVGAFLYH
jgi:O-antigen/teichoic acid export membrane protein